MHNMYMYMHVCVCVCARARVCVHTHTPVSVMSMSPSASIKRKASCTARIWSEVVVQANDGVSQTGHVKAKKRDCFSSAVNWPSRDRTCSSAKVSKRQHTSAYVSIRQYTSVTLRRASSCWEAPFKESIRQHTSAYVSYLEEGIELLGSAV